MERNSQSFSINGKVSIEPNKYKMFAMQHSTKIDAQYERDAMASTF